MRTRPRPLPRTATIAAAVAISVGTLLLGARDGRAQDGRIGRAAMPPDGTIVESAPCPPPPDASGTDPGIECRRIRYLSDGLRVVGYIWKPRDTGGRRLPIVIFNRGGTRERSRLEPWMAGGFREFVSRGFVVIGSQYRGVDGGEGAEEYGGADVRDVLNLVPLARSLDYVDMRNVFLFGNSRGGMMTYLALKHGLPANAAAVMSGITDLAGNAEDAPGYFPASYASLIPDYAVRPAEAMRERSAVAWPERITAPLLVLHGTADTIVSARRALEFAQRLQAIGATYQLVLYAGDDHGLRANRRDVDARVIAWFTRYLR